MRILTLICISLLLVPALAFSQQSQPATQTVPAASAAAGVDDDVAKAVESKIMNQKKVKIDDLKVTHANATIYLEGIANVFGSYYMAEKVARQYSGIKNVVNNIGVRKSKVADGDIQLNVIQRAQVFLKPEPFDLVSVKVEKGVVTLLGNVVDTSLPDKVFNEAIWIPGVQNVINKMELAPLSTGDDRLRYTIYQLLAAEFPQYFRAVHPPVVILVNSGRVVLVGSVNNEGDKRRMVSRIRSLPGILSVNEQLGVGE